MDIPRKQRTHVKVAAHRGASGNAPENTLPAFRTALDLKVRLIELDVHLSADNEIVVIHDDRVDRTTNGKGKVGHLTLTQLRKLDAGSWFNRAQPKKACPEFAVARIPLLQEVIDLVRERDAELYIEIKDPDLYAEDFESKIVALLHHNEFEKRAVLLSFSAVSVEKVKRVDPAIRTALLLASLKLDPVSAALAAGADELAIRHTLLTPVVVRECRQAGLGVTVWTVNRVSAIRRAIASGVDCIISNYPERVLHLLDE
ncbi:MAG TPA: glycerophosphodiester phosphodiesterase family protein [Acidobacteriota bacterium]|nr:glycerophosphodiester phosphodiesterase family protein [Acidobacteriota bacterium]